MDRELLMQHFLMAERHVAEGEEHVLRQRALVDRLATDGHDVRAAEYLLQEFEQSLALHAAERDRLRAELVKSA